MLCLLQGIAGDVDVQLVDLEVCGCDVAEALRPITGRSPINSPLQGVIWWNDRRHPRRALQIHVDAYVVIGEILVADQRWQIVGQGQFDLFAVARRRAIFAQRLDPVGDDAGVAGPRGL